MEAGRPKIKMPTDSVSGESLLSGSQMVPSTGTSHGRNEGSLQDLFYKGSDLIPPLL